MGLAGGAGGWLLGAGVAGLRLKGLVPKSLLAGMCVRDLELLSGFGLQRLLGFGFGD